MEITTLLWGSYECGQKSDLPTLSPRLPGAFLLPETLYFCYNRLIK